VSFNIFIITKSNQALYFSFPPKLKFLLPLINKNSKDAQKGQSGQHMCSPSVLVKAQRPRRTHTKIKSILIWGENKWPEKRGKCQGRRKARKSKVKEAKLNRSRKTQTARSQQTTPYPQDNPSIACA